MAYLADLPKIYFFFLFIYFPWSTVDLQCCQFLLYSKVIWLYVYIHWRKQWQPTPVLLPGKSHGRRSLVGCSPWGHEESDTTERLHFHALEKEMATHSSALAWRIPETGEPGGLLSMGSHRVGHDWSNLAAAAAYILFFNIHFYYGLS